MDIMYAAVDSGSKVLLFSFNNVNYWIRGFFFNPGPDPKQWLTGVVSHTFLAWRTAGI